MKIAAIVVTYNRIEQLKITVERLLSEGLDKIIVVDNLSSDGTRNWLRSISSDRVDVIELDKNGGGALGFEMGLRYAVRTCSVDWFVLMDDDGRPDIGSINNFRCMDLDGVDSVAASVYFPSGEICDMNRPWVNPFSKPKYFIKTLFAGRAGFHISNSDYNNCFPRSIDGASFVGLFVSKKVVERVGYPDGRLFIYGDDVLYTLRITKSGSRMVFNPNINFTHDCSTLARGNIFRPLWKTYYHHRNLWFVYRRAAGPIMFWPIISIVILKWLMKPYKLSGHERSIYRGLIHLAILDAIQNRLSRDHNEIVDRSRT